MHIYHHKLPFLLQMEYPPYRYFLPIGNSFHDIPYL